MGTSGSVRQLFLLLALDLYTSMTVGQEIVLTYKFMEEQAKETFVGNVAVDSLLKANVTQDELNQMRFQILTQGNIHASYFSIDEISSTIRTAQVLDRETLCSFEVDCLLEFSVAVYKQDPDRNNQLDLYKIFAIKVNLTDDNDNAPTFPESEVSLSVLESVSVDFVLLTSGAVDPDMGLNNSVQLYELIPSNEMFGLKEIKNLDGSSDLGLVVRYRLDRETKDFYQVKIIAKDGGFPQRTGTCTVNITVIDTNDNKPLFTEATYDVKIPENLPIGHSVLVLQAQDSDIGENGEFSFGFSARVTQKIQDIFAVNSTSGEVTIKAEIDYEQEQKYQFLVEVKDHGRESQSSSAMVTVEVQDVNDNAPQININLPPGGTDILESEEVGRYVANLVVSDADDGANGNIQCQILGNKFKLEEIYTNMYKILIASKLDYEHQLVHNVTIQCQDHGTPSKQNTTSFLINVLDANDNHPIFQQSVYRASVDENNEINEYLIQVKATDIDTGDNAKITYFLHTDAKDYFVIDPVTGVISTNKSFDRELEPEIQFHVNASDSGDPQLKSHALVIVSVMDKNDNAPTFKREHFHFFALEGQKDLPIIGKLIAEDPDAGSNGQFSFDFVSQKLPEFEMDYNTGEIRAGNLDRELYTTYNFTVKVTDKGVPALSSTAVVLVQVLDENDNMPQIIYPDTHNNTVSLPYTARIGTLIAKVEAIDIDEGDNSKLLYYIDRITPGNMEIFKMDVNSGELRVSKEMRLYDANTYRIVLGVRNGEFTMYANLNVIITVSNNTQIATTPTHSETNIVIVVAIVIVTVVLSAVIIIAICILLRRVDQNRCLHQKNKSKSHDGVVIRPGQQENLSPALSHLSENQYKNKNKKEVSFSISDGNESDSMNLSTLTNITTFSSFKNQQSGFSSIDGKLLENPVACSSLITNNTLHSDMSKDAIMEKKIDLNHLYSQPLHRAQSPSERLWLQQLKEEEAKKMREILQRKADDVNSEMSAESATSDSGRGGSEEDINSNKGHPLSDTEEARQSYQSDFRRGEEMRHTPTKHSNILHSSHPGKAVPKTDSYRRNISFSDDSVTANTTVDSNKARNGKNKSQHKYNPNYSQNSLYHNNVPIRTPDSRELYFHEGRTHLDTLNEVTPSTFGPRYSLQDIDDTISESIATRDDDGNSTTTSGSYTINPEELAQEIDNLFFHSDVIV